MGRINLSLVAALLVFGQEFARVHMATRNAARRRASAPVVARTRHQYTLLDSLVAAGWAAAANGDWAALDGRVSGLTGEQLYFH